MYGTLNRFSPRTAHTNQLHALGRVFDDLFSAARSYEAGETTRTWQPLVDIIENDHAYEVKAELPGIAKEDVQLTVENNVLTLSGERKFEKDVNQENCHRIERSYGAFSRSFTLPSRVDAEKVEARYENGVLTVVVPKAVEARPKKITIA